MGESEKRVCKAESLERVGVDCVDLLQYHEVIRFDDADRIFTAGGAMEAFVAARKAGKIRTAKHHGFSFDATKRNPEWLGDESKRTMQLTKD